MVGPMPKDSSANAISISGLTKRFGSFTSVDELTVDIPTGGVVGLLGPNGAGKSTTIRMLLGLIRPTSGSATVLGHPVTHPQGFLPRVGALIESPTMYPKLSAERNLRSLARLAGVSDGRVAEVLHIVGLTGREQAVCVKNSEFSSPKDDLYQVCLKLVSLFWRRFFSQYKYM